MTPERLRRFALWSFAILVGLGASAGARAENPTPMLAVFETALTDIQTTYLEPVRLRILAVAGIGGLDTPDKSFLVEDDGDQIEFLEQGQVFSSVPAPPADDTHAWAKLIVTAIDAAKSHALALAPLDDDAITQRIFDGMITKLDRFTHYADREQARRQLAARDGYGGIGITLDYTGKQPKVTEMMDNAPGSIGGLATGDRLLAIDGQTVSDLTPQQIGERMRGQVDSMVTLLIARGEQNRPLSFQLKRARIIRSTVTAEIEGDIAIFHLSGFNAASAKDLGDAMSSVRRRDWNNLTGAILDLRDNPGGLLDQAAAVAGLFLDDGMISTTTGRIPKATQKFPAPGSDRLRGLPLVVLVDGRSASSAEIVASALEDLGRAVIVGSTSYGKGTVQIVLPLPNDGNLTLTWARLFSPAGYALQGHGVVPMFCSTQKIDQLGPAQTMDERVTAAIDHGFSTKRPERLSAMSDADWQVSRLACPSEEHDPALDLRIAGTLLHDHALYRRAVAQGES